MANTKSGYFITKKGNYKIYLIENRINGKGYVGYTMRDVGLRWSNHKQSAKKNNQSRFYHAIRKYGEDCWDIYILAEFDGTREEAWKVEKFYIENLNTHKKGYNANSGGSGGWVVKDKEKWMLNRNDAGENNSRYSGLTDDDLLNLMYDAYIKFGNVSSKEAKSWLHAKSFPKSLSQFRFPNYPNKPTRHYIAFKEKFNIRPEEFLTKKAYETWQRLNQSSE